MIYIAGLQRTGTNFASSVYANSIDIDPARGYHKHMMKIKGKDLEDCQSVICVIKNPYTWVESICYRSCANIFTSEVAAYKEYNLHDDIHGIGAYREHDAKWGRATQKINVKNLCTLYKDFYTSWLEYDKTQLVYYEELVKSNRDKIHNIVPESSNWEPRRLKTYLSYTTSLLSDDVIHQITDTLGKDFFNKIGYPTK